MDRSAMFGVVVVSGCALLSACSSSTATPGGGACMAGPTATFELKVTGTTAYCDGQGCGAGWLTLERQDGTPLAIDTACQASCVDCAPQACPNLCVGATVISANGVQRVWDGTYYEQGTCGSSVACAQPQCVAGGTYVAHMCGFAAAADGGVGTCNGGTTTPTCTDVTFAWPPSSTVMGTIGN